MSCPNECYVIGGPWIAENPGCPMHGRGFEAEERHPQNLLARIKELEARLNLLERKPE